MGTGLLDTIVTNLMYGEKYMRNLFALAVFASLTTTTLGQPWYPTPNDDYYADQGEYDSSTNEIPNVARHSGTITYQPHPGSVGTVVPFSWVTDNDPDSPFSPMIVVQDIDICDYIAARGLIDYNVPGQHPNDELLIVVHTEQEAADFRNGYWTPSAPTTPIQPSYNSVGTVDIPFHLDAWVQLEDVTTNPSDPENGTPIAAYNTANTTTVGAWPRINFVWEESTTQTSTCNIVGYEWAPWVQWSNNFTWSECIDNGNCYSFWQPVVDPNYVDPNWANNEASLEGEPDDWYQFGNYTFQEILPAFPAIAQTTFTGIQQGNPNGEQISHITSPDIGINFDVLFPNDDQVPADNVLPSVNPEDWWQPQSPITIPTTPESTNDDIFTVPTDFDVPINTEDPWDWDKPNTTPLNILPLDIDTDPIFPMFPIMVPNDVTCIHVPIIIIPGDVGAGIPDTVIQFTWCWGHYWVEAYPI